jgi:hypothetical protein
MKNKSKLSAIVTATVLLSSLMLLGSVAVPSVNALKTCPGCHVEINAQLNVCFPPSPCVMVTLQAHASGPADSITGRLLISPAHGEPFTPPDPCIADVTGAVNPAATYVTLTGTLHPPNPTHVCAGDLQGVSVSLFAASTGNIMLTMGEEVLASGMGTVNIVYPVQTT